MDHNPLPFAPTEETRMLQDLVARFVDKELIPLEPAILKREAEGKLTRACRRSQVRAPRRCTPSNRNNTAEAARTPRRRRSCSASRTSSRRSPAAPG